MRFAVEFLLKTWLEGRLKRLAVKMAPKKKQEDDGPSLAARFGRVKTNLKMGIVGLPNVGKSSLFNLLTQQSVAAENFPFCTIDPTDARCAVPDAQYEALVDVWKPPSQYPPYLWCTDIAGLVRGASEGEGLGNAFLSHIQAVDGIYHVVRAFDDTEITHVDDSIDPVRDLETIQFELCQKDIAYVDAQEALEKKGLQGGKFKLSENFLFCFEKVRELLNASKPVREYEWSNVQIEMIRDKLPALITTKPVVYLVNMSAADFLRKKNKWLAKVHKWIGEHGGGQMLPFSIEWEQKAWELRDDADALTAHGGEGGAKSVLPKMVTLGYSELNLIYFFTAGEKEVRCWTLYNGSLAPQAAGVIHSDFERGFIKAEVVAYSDWDAAGREKGMSAVKAAGKFRQEGKQYLVKNGDIIHFMFNVTADKKK